MSDYNQSDPVQGRVGIVTDSTADVPGRLAAAYHIAVVNNFMEIEGQSLEDGVDISREEFYARLPGLSAQPTTGTAPVGTYEQLYERLLNEGCTEIVSIHISSKLSGVLNAANTAAQQFPGRVHVFDSLAVSMGLGWQVVAAAEAAGQGASAPQVLDLLEEARESSRLVAMLDTLEYVRRSGRVSWAKAQLGNLLKIRPFVEIKDGVVQSHGEARTRSKGIARLKQILLEQGPLDRLAILHTNTPDDAAQILAELDLKLPHPPIVTSITPIIGAHVGPNALGFAALIKP